VNQKLFGISGVHDGKPAAWKDDDMEYTSVLSKQSKLYNQFRYLCEMRDLFTTADTRFDAGFDSTFWKTNLFIMAAESELKHPFTPGHKKHATLTVWENSEFWRATLPKWFPSGESNRFMRLLQALDIPKPTPF
jgi:hypothetical protein